MYPYKHKVSINTLDVANAATDVGVVAALRNELIRMFGYTSAETIEVFPPHYDDEPYGPYCWKFDLTISKNEVGKIGCGWTKIIFRFSWSDIAAMLNSDQTKNLGIPSGVPMSAQQS